ncbi:hypothetical protein D3C86_2258080 [compost metagenome]
MFGEFGLKLYQRAGARKKCDLTVDPFVQVAVADETPTGKNQSGTLAPRRKIRDE